MRSVNMSVTQIEMSLLDAVSSNLFRFPQVCIFSFRGKKS